MMIPEPTEFPKAPLANFSSAVNQFGVSAEDMSKGVLTLANSDTEVDLIGFSYSVNPNNLSVKYSDLVSDTVYTSSRPEPIQELHNCNNCGGTVDEEGYCRYCGSRVYFFGEHKPKFHNKFDCGF